MKVSAFREIQKTRLVYPQIPRTVPTELATPGLGVASREYARIEGEPTTEVIDFRTSAKRTAGGDYKKSSRSSPETPMSPVVGP